MFRVWGLRLIEVGVWVCPPYSRTNDLLRFASHAGVTEVKRPAAATLLKVLVG